MKRNLSKLVVMLLVVIVVSGIPATVATAQDDGKTELRINWWGSDARNEIMNEIADMYEAEHSDITIVREPAGAWGDYWDKLATQIAGGNAPDVIHMHQDFLPNYAGRGALLPLDEYVESGVINLSDYPQPIIDFGYYEGKLYMVSLGNTGPCIFYNATLFEQAGMEVPTGDWTWEEFAQTILDVSEALGPEYFGSDDPAFFQGSFEIFVRQRGGQLYNETGDGLGYEKQDLIDFWSLWVPLIEAGAVPQPDVSLEDATGQVQDTLFGRGLAALHVHNANSLPLFYDLEDEINVVLQPNSGDPDAPTGYFMGGVYLSIPADTENPEAAAEYLNWFVNDPEAVITYEAQHGPPAGRELKEIVRPHLNDLQAKHQDYVGVLAELVELPGKYPAQHAEVMEAYLRAYERAAFGQISVEEAADLFFEEATLIFAG